MKTLSGTLLTMVRADTRVPAVSAVASQARGGVPFFRWTRWYSGAESDTPHALAVHDSGSVTRARISGGNLLTQSIISPSPSSAWSTWSTIGAARNLAGVALCAIPGTNGEVWVAYSDSAANQVLVRRSTDYGATWGAAVGLGAVGVAVEEVGLYLADTNTGILFFSAGAGLYRVRRSAGAWGGAVLHTPSGWSSFDGVAVDRRPGRDSVVVLSGIESPSNEKKVSAYYFGEGASFTLNTWSAEMPIQRADAAGTISYYKHPSVRVLSDDTILCSFSEKENAGYTTQLGYWCHSMRGGVVGGELPWFSEPSILESDGFQFGVVLGGYGQYWYASITRGVWRSEVPGVASDLSARVVRVSGEVAHDGARVEVELDNRDGLLTGASNVSVPGLMVGGSLRLRLGYASGAGGAAEYGTAWDLVVSRLVFLQEDGARRVRVRCVGPWERADVLHWRQALSASAPKGTLFKRVMARAGVTVRHSAGDAPGSQWTTSHVPTFLVASGERASAAAGRLLRDEPEGTFLDDADLLVRAVSALDGADYTFGEGAGQQRVLRLAVVDEPPRTNWVQLVGPDRYYNAVARASLDQHGPRAEQLRELDAVDNVRVVEYGEGALRRAAWQEARGELVAAWHPGLEPLDVISVTVSGLVTGALFRVLGVGIEFDTGTRPVYNAVLRLGEV